MYDMVKEGVLEREASFTLKNLPASSNDERRESEPSSQTISSFGAVLQPEHSWSHHNNTISLERLGVHYKNQAPP